MERLNKGLQDSVLLNQKHRCVEGLCVKYCEQFKITTQFACQQSALKQVIMEQKAFVCVQQSGHSVWTQGSCVCLFDHVDGSVSLCFCHLMGAASVLYKRWS